MELRHPALRTPRGRAPELALRLRSVAALCVGDRGGTEVPPARRGAFGPSARLMPQLYPAG
eukprot:2512215-Alexandrium_andersonii.AAC.1